MRYQFDNGGRQVGTFMFAGLSLASLKTAINDTTGAVSSSAQSKLRSVSTQTYDAQGRVYQSTTDAGDLGQVLSITRTGTIATASLTHQHTLAIGETVVMSGSTQSAYNGSFTITGVTDTAFSFTVSGSPSNDTGGSARGWADRKLTSKTWYDLRGMPIKSSSPNGIFSKMAYDGAGRQVASYVSYDSSENDTLYSAADDVTGDTVLEQQQTYYKGTLPVVSASFQRTSSSTSTGALAGNNSFLQTSAMWYDRANRMTTSANFGKDNSSTRYVFNSSGVLIDSNSNGVPDVAESSALARSTATDYPYIWSSTSYDDAGRTGSTTDNAGHKTAYLYDLLGRQTRMVENYADGVADIGDDNVDRTTNWIYDSFGRLQMLQALKPGAYGIGNENTLYFYSSDFNRSQPSYTLYPDSANIDDFSLTSDGKGERTFVTTGDDFVSVTYDRLGRTLTSTDQRGVEHTYAYDTTTGQLVSDKVTSLGSSGVVDGSIRAIGYAYDDQGRIASITSYSNLDMASNHIANQVTKTYDNWGNVALTRQSHEGAVTSSTPAVQYLYADGATGGDAKFVRLAKVTYPSGRQVHYLYGNSGDANDRLSRVYEVSGTPSFTDPSFYARYTYQGAGTILSETQASGNTKLDVTFDRFGRVSSQDWNKVSGSTATQINTFGYTFDASSNRLTKSTLANANSREAIEDYSYDGLNRLSGFNSQVTEGYLTSFGTSQSWSGLDALGNWRTFTENEGGSITPTLEQTRSTNVANEIEFIGATTGSDWFDPIYDSAGNMISMPIPGDETSSQEAIYDAWNRMVSVKQGTTTVAAYEYDGLTRRITETDAAGTIEHVFFNDQWQVLEQFKNDRPLPDESNIWSLRYIDALITQDKVTNADDGSVDTTWAGGDGYISTNVGSGQDLAYGSALQPDGKLVVVGTLGSSTNADAFVIRYTEDGVLDTTFSSDGKVTLDITNGYDRFQDVKILPDGKILAVGFAGFDTILARFNADGSLDTTFGDTVNTPGRKLISLDGGGTGFLDGAMNVAIDSSGRIVIVGQQRDTGSDYDILAARFLANGSGLDTTFGSNGLDIFDLGSSNEIANAMAIDTQGRIVLAGNSGDAGMLMRLTSSGSLDTSFDSDGWATYALSGITNFTFTDVAIDRSGRYVVTGSFNNGSHYEMVAMRMNAAGSLDTSFATSGMLRSGVNNGWNGGTSIVLQPDDKIIIGGAINLDTAIWRLDPTGAYDSTFGTSGHVITTLGASTNYDQWTTVQSDGKHLYLAGWEDGFSSTTKVAVMRFNTGVVANQTLYFQQDANFNVTSVTNSGGEVKERYGYTPYGERTTYTAESVTLADTGYDQQYGFQGSKNEKGIKLAGLGVRWLHFSLGSWTTADPAGYLDGTTLYSFVSGNPITYSDPSGLSKQSPDTFEGAGNGGTIVVDGSSIEIGVVLSKAKDEEYIRLIARSPKDKYNCEKCEWLQFVHRVVDNPGQKIKFKNKNGDMYDNTVDPKNPIYRTDNNSKDSPYASLNYNGAKRKDAYFELVDAPKFAVVGKAESAIYDSFLVCGGNVVYHVHWERHKDVKNVKSYENISGGAASTLPDWAKNTLTNDGFKDPTVK